MLKLSEAKQKIRLKWLERPEEERTKLHVLSFYMDLEKNRSELLNFRCSGDKYQKVMSFLRNYTID